MSRKRFIFHLLFLGFVFFTSCTKDKAPEETPLGWCGTPSPTSIKIDFTNFVGTDSLVLSTQQYLNANSDTFSVNTLHYYVSNIILTKLDNSTFVEPESYRLIKQEDTSTFSFFINSVPEGEYKSITFTIGVDSTRNVSGAQTGALDPVHNMFWSWSSGYLFTKFEALSPQSPTGFVNFHIGGFNGINNALRTVTLNFPTNANVSQTTTPKVHIKTDLNEWFVNPSTIKFGVTYDVTMAGPMAKMMSDNYKDMFSVMSVEN